MNFDQLTEPLDRRLADGLARLAAVARQLDWQAAASAGLSPTQADILRFVAGRPKGARLTAAAAQESGHLGIDLDFGGWASANADSLRKPGTWWLFSKTTQTPVMGVVIEPGDQGYFTNHHVGNLMTATELMAYGLGKKKADGTMCPQLASAQRRNLRWRSRGRDRREDAVDAMGDHPVIGTGAHDDPYRLKVSDYGVHAAIIPGNDDGTPKFNWGLAYFTGDEVAADADTDLIVLPNLTLDHVLTLAQRN